MTATATHHVHDTTTARALFLAFELSEKTWKLGFTPGHGQKPRERAVAVRHQARLLQEIAQAKRRFGLPETVSVISCYEAGGKASGYTAFCKLKGSPTMWWIPPPLRPIAASVEPRVDGLDMRKLSPPPFSKTCFPRSSCHIPLVGPTIPRSASCVQHQLEARHTASALIRCAPKRAAVRR